MKTITRAAALLLALLLLLSGLSACDTAAPAASGKLKIVTTVFPLYDWVSVIVGTDVDADVTLLLDDGVDLHSYQPTADDIVKIATCDLFVYVGGESDAWVADALKEATNKDRIVLNLLDVLGDAVREEEIKEGMEAEEEEGEEEEEPEYDEHVWLSLRHAQTLCTAIAEKLGALDPDHAAAFAANAKAYNGELHQLDEAYAAAVAAAPVKTLVFADRFPFRYLVEDYGLDYYAAFVGCSAESEASFETVVFLAHKIDALGLGSILQIESADGKLADTVRENTKDKNQTVRTLDSLQSVTREKMTLGATYYSIMQTNLTVLQKALQ